MPDSLLFNGTTDYIRMTAGTAVGPGDTTIAMVVKHTASSAAYHNYVGFNTIDAGFYNSNANPGRVGLYTGVNEDISSFSVGSADGWVLVAHTRGPGATEKGDFHRYIWNTSTWTHSLGSSDPGAAIPSITRLIIGANGTLADSFLNANILIAGWWNSELLPVTIESLANGMQAWVAAAPAEAWRFNSTGSISSFSGTSTEAARVGTTLDVGDAPVGWADLTVGAQRAVFHHAPGTGLW